MNNEIVAKVVVEGEDIVSELADMTNAIASGMPVGCSMEFAAGYHAACKVVTQQVENIVKKHVVIRRDDASGDLFHHPL